MWRAHGHDCIIFSCIFFHQVYIFQHDLHLWIYYMSKFLNTSEFIIMINSHLDESALSSNHNAKQFILITCKHSQRAAWSFVRGLENRLKAINCFSIFTQVFCVFWDWIYFNFTYFFVSDLHKTASRHFENFGFVIFTCM
jgi:hypothetical protein